MDEKMNPVIKFALDSMFEEIAKKIVNKSSYLDNTGHKVIEAEYKVLQ